ncbi:MAG: carbonic anhydrase [Pseudomonadota bacterium]
MPAFRELVDGYKRFRTGRWRYEQALYERLGEGQSPGTMVIGCADSRVEPAEIFDTIPGQMFVVRNVANLVPPYEVGGGLHGVSAALEFAVKALKVRYILVVGHCSCGGIRAAVEALDGGSSGEFIAPWVEIAAEARARVLERMPDAGADEIAAALEHEAIRSSIANLMTFPFVREAVEAGALTLRGAWFEIGSGDLLVLDESTGNFEKVVV